jgi:hypothetical protein
MFSARTSDLEFLVDTLSKTDDPSSGFGPDRLLEYEDIYWQSVARFLKVGWQTAKASDGTPLYPGLLVQYKLFRYTLDKVIIGNRVDHYNQVEQIHAFWLATPQLNDESDPDGVVSECNMRLKSLGNGEPTTAP